jgi:hypothetical protein
MEKNSHYFVLNENTLLFPVVDCQHPGVIENGRVVLPNLTTTFRSSVEYHCVPQYERVGPYLRRCTEDGVWSGDEPRCESE